VRNEDIDAAVASGDLTQEEADRLKERLEALPEGALGPPFGHFKRGVPMGPGEFKRGPGRGMHFGFGFALPGELDELAGFLGITPEQLREELGADGATLATVAEAHGKSRDDLKAFLLEAANERLANAVSEGDLTQERADEIRTRLEEHLDDVIDHGFPGFGGRGDGPRFRFEFRGEWEEPVAPDEQAPSEQSFES
jgi:hypothetical protein